MVKTTNLYKGPPSLIVEKSNVGITSRGFLRLREKKDAGERDLGVGVGARVGNKGWAIVRTLAIKTERLPRERLPVKVEIEAASIMSSNLQIPGKEKVIGKCRALPLHLYNRSLGSDRTLVTALDRALVNNVAAAATQSLSLLLAEGTAGIGPGVCLAGDIDEEILSIAGMTKTRSGLGVKRGRGKCQDLSRIH